MAKPSFVVRSWWKSLATYNAADGVDAYPIHSKVEVDGGEVFRAPHWSAGVLHLHFSVARGIIGLFG